MPRLILAAFLLVFFKSLATAQPVSKNIKHQNLIWLRYSQRLVFNEKWAIYGEIETRRFVSPDRQHQWLIPRLTLYYKTKNNIDLGLSNAVFLHALPQNDHPVELIRPEIRPHQEISLHQSLGKCKVTHRYIVEERFLHKTKQGELAPGWDFNLRFRYRIQIQIPVVSKEKKIPVHLRLYEEIFINSSKKMVYNIFDHNRLYAGFSFKFSDQWSSEIGYINWFQQQPSGQDFFDRHIIRITLSHSIKI